MLFRSTFLLWEISEVHAHVSKRWRERGHRKVGKGTSVCFKPTTSSRNVYVTWRSPSTASRTGRATSQATFTNVLWMLEHWQAGLRSRRFSGGVGFLTTLGVGVRFFCPTPEVQLNHFLHHTPKLGIPVGMIQFLLKLLLKQRILAVSHDFHWLLFATKLLTTKLHSRYVKESESDILER